MKKKGSFLKQAGDKKTTLSFFDLLGDNELALSKAFAYLLSSDKIFLSNFLKMLCLEKLVTKKSYENCSISIEVSHSHGRSDIEIQIGGKLIIIEAKVRKNRATQQQIQKYREEHPNALIVLLSSVQEKHITNIDRLITWNEISEHFTRLHLNKPLLNDFLEFYNKLYRRTYMKEILVQNVGDRVEIERFEKFQVYRRSSIACYPLYFSPYYTRNSGKIVGLSKIARVLGVLQTNQIQTSIPQEKLKSFAVQSKFASDKDYVLNLINKWQKGLKLSQKSNNKKIWTYYFLDFPVSLPFPLKKSSRKQSKHWIASSIGSNVGILCETLFEKIIEQKK